MEVQEPETDGSLKGVSYMANADGLSLYCRVWEPSMGEGQRPRAAVFVAHGLGSHCLLGMEKLVGLLIDQGILVFAHDHVNHGRSEGERGVIPDLNILVRDVLQHVDAITSKHSDIPVFLLGRSLGGLVCTAATLERPEQFAGLMLIAPALKTPTAWQQRLITEDPYEWGYERIKLQSALNLAEHVTRTLGLLPIIACPFLVMHGEDDTIINVSASRNVYHLIKSNDKEIKTYPNCRHALLLEEEEDAAKVLQDIADCNVRRYIGDEDKACRREGMSWILRQKKILRPRKILRERKILRQKAQ
ncbi:MGLL [Branchiostoma lanceolatum]|uniref:MGLL protein n=1 Tax=Branchiostoma lanceolatum TaxID=7740 RepID=A0A8J9YJZ2_BRALA|nr:MGLL [Branchiostoma lanceolatum]